MLRTSVVLAFLVTYPAAADPVWSPLIGTWRTTEHVSCGIDDVRRGAMTSIAARTLRVGFVHCVIEDGRLTDGAYEIDAECDLGGGYMTRLSYAWRMLSEDRTLMSHEGYERELVRCVGDLE